MGTSQPSNKMKQPPPPTSHQQQQPLTTTRIIQQQQQLGELASISNFTNTAFHDFHKQLETMVRTSLQVLVKQQDDDKEQEVAVAWKQEDNDHQHQHVHKASKPMFVYRYDPQTLDELIRWGFDWYELCQYHDDITHSTSDQNNNNSNQSTPLQVILSNVLFNPTVVPYACHVPVVVQTLLQLLLSELPFYQSKSSSFDRWNTTSTNATTNTTAINNNNNMSSSLILILQSIISCIRRQGRNRRQLHHHRHPLWLQHLASLVIPCLASALQQQQQQFHNARPRLGSHHNHYYHAPYSQDPTDTAGDDDNIDALVKYFQYLFYFIHTMMDVVAVASCQVSKLDDDDDDMPKQQHVPSSSTTAVAISAHRMTTTTAAAAKNIIQFPALLLLLQHLEDWDVSMLLLSLQHHQSSATTTSSSLKTNSSSSSSRRCNNDDDKTNHNDNTNNPKKRKRRPKCATLYQLHGEDPHDDENDDEEIKAIEHDDDTDRDNVKCEHHNTWSYHHRLRCQQQQQQQQRPRQHTAAWTISIKDVVKASTGIKQHQHSTTTSISQFTRLPLEAVLLRSKCYKTILSIVHEQATMSESLLPSPVGSRMDKTNRSTTTTGCPIRNSSTTTTTTTNTSCSCCCCSDQRIGWLSDLFQLVIHKALSSFSSSSSSSSPSAAASYRLCLVLMADTVAAATAASGKAKTTAAATTTTTPTRACSCAYQLLVDGLMQHVSVATPDETTTTTIRIPTDKYQKNYSYFNPRHHHHGMQQHQQKEEFIWRTYSEILVDCHHFDSRETCWNAMQPLVQVVKRVTETMMMKKTNSMAQHQHYHHHHPEDLPLPSFRCLAYVLCKRRRLLTRPPQTNGDDTIGRQIQAFVNHLSLWFGHERYWILPTSSKSNGDEKESMVITTLQLLGIIGIVNATSSDCLDQDDDDDDNDGVQEDGAALRHPCQQNESTPSSSSTTSRTTTPATTTWPFANPHTFRCAYRRMGPRVSKGRQVLSRLDHDLTISSNSRLQSKKEINDSNDCNRPLSHLTPAAMDYLNDDTLRTMFSYLGYKRLVWIRQVCKTWLSIADQDCLWQDAYLTRFHPVNLKVSNSTAGESSWKQLFINKYKAERRIRFLRNKQTGWKVRTCRYVGCLQIVRNPEQMKRHYYEVHEKRSSNSKKSNKNDITNKANNVHSKKKTKRIRRGI